MKREEIYRHLDAITSLETERLKLRRLTTNDAQALFAVASNDEVSKYLLWNTHPSLSYTKRYLKNLMRLYQNHTYFEWGVFLKDSDVLIGTCGFTAFDFLTNNAEIGYSFGVSYWGHGYATEAVGAVLKCGFETLSLARIKACYAMVNVASAAVLYKNGMLFLGETERMFLKGTECRIGMSAITREAYFEMQVQKAAIAVQF